MDKCTHCGKTGPAGSMRSRVLCPGCDDRLAEITETTPMFTCGICGKEWPLWMHRGTFDALYCRDCSAKMPCGPPGLVMAPGSPIGVTDAGLSTQGRPDLASR